MRLAVDNVRPAPRPSAVYANLFGRGCLQVFFVSLNVSFIARGAYVPAFFTALAISWLWWVNTRSAAWEGLAYARLFYALGAASGTVLGMLLARVL